MAFDVPQSMSKKVVRYCCAITGRLRVSHERRRPAHFSPVKVGNQEETGFCVACAALVLLAESCASITQTPCICIFFGCDTRGFPPSSSVCTRNVRQESMLDNCQFFQVARVSNCHDRVAMRSICLKFKQLNSVGRKRRRCLSSTF